MSGLDALRGQRVLVLVDEMQQFTRLLSMLTVEARFAHGGGLFAHIHHAGFALFVDMGQ